MAPLICVSALQPHSWNDSFHGRPGTGRRRPRYAGAGMFGEESYIPGSACDGTPTLRRRRGLPPPGVQDEA